MVMQKQPTPATEALKTPETMTLDKVVDIVESERQRAVLYSHLAVVVNDFLENDCGGPALSITSTDGSVAPARRAVVEDVAEELERLAHRARGHMRRMLAAPVAVDVSPHPDDDNNTSDKVIASVGGTVTNTRPRERS